MEFYREDYIKYILVSIIVLFLYDYLKIDNRYIIPMIIIIIYIIRDKLFSKKIKENNNIDKWLYEISIYRNYNNKVFDDLISELDRYFNNEISKEDILSIYDSFIFALPIEFINLHNIKRKELIYFLNADKSSHVYSRQKVT